MLVGPLLDTARARSVTIIRRPIEVKALHMEIYNPI
jgi:hypothetical protein